MRLTMCLLRKRKMNKKPQSFIRSWQWNNSWYLNQERRVLDTWHWKGELEERNIPIYKPEELLSSIHSELPEEDFEVTETKLGELKNDESHPLWQDEKVYSWKNLSWLPKGRELVTACNLTNSLYVNSLPHSGPQTSFSGTTESRLSTLIKNAFIGDAVQRKLPKNWMVPFIGWHPVESKMRPRNQYDWKAFSWGRNMPREYGVPNLRKLTNLNSSLVKEIIVSSGLSSTTSSSVIPDIHRQFIRFRDGKLIRLYLDVPLSVFSSKPCPQIMSSEEVDSKKEVSIESIAPLSALASLQTTNIYRNQSNHPIRSLQHTQPFLNTTFDFDTSHIAPQWQLEVQRSKCLMLAFTAALGQARLRFGPEVEGTLPQPVNINVIGTDGPRYVLATFQLNTLDLGGNVRNVFWSHPDTLNLFEFCGYREAKVFLEGVNLETFNMISNLLCNRF